MHISPIVVFVVQCFSEYSEASAAQLDNERAPHETRGTQLILSHQYTSYNSNFFCIGANPVFGWLGL